MNAGNINDGETPGSSRDGSSYFDWWNKNGSQEWVEYTWEKPVTVSEAQVYWFDDQPGGGVRVPAAWRLVYKDGTDWKPVETVSAYGVEKNKFNAVSFKPVTASAMRLEITAQLTASIGVQEWKLK
jgi:hypothetical protein